MNFQSNNSKTMRSSGTRVLTFFASFMIVKLCAEATPSPRSSCGEATVWTAADQCGRSWKDTETSVEFCSNFAMAYFLPPDDCRGQSREECVKAHELLSTTRNLWGLRVSDVIAEWSAVIAAVVRARYTGYRRAHATLSLAILGIADLIMQLAFVAISFGATESYAFLEDAQSAACTNIEGALAMEEMLSYFEDMKYLGVIELFICALGLFMDAVNADGKDSWKMAITQVSLFLLNASLSTVAFVVISSKAQKGMESLFSAMYKTRASSNGRIERTEEVKNEISWCIQMFIGDACKPLGVPPPFNGWLILLFTLLGLMVVFTCVYATQKGYDYVKDIVPACLHVSSHL